MACRETLCVACVDAGRAKVAIIEGRHVSSRGGGGGGRRCRGGGGGCRLRNTEVRDLEVLADAPALRRRSGRVSISGARARSIQTEVEAANVRGIQALASYRIAVNRVAGPRWAAAAFTHAQVIQGANVNVGTAAG